MKDEYTKDEYISSGNKKIKVYDYQRAYRLEIRKVQCSECGEPVLIGSRLSNWHYTLTYQMEGILSEEKYICDKRSHFGDGPTVFCDRRNCEFYRAENAGYDWCEGPRSYKTVDPAICVFCGKKHNKGCYDYRKRWIDLVHLVLSKVRTYSEKFYFHLLDIENLQEKCAYCNRNFSCTHPCGMFLFEEDKVIICELCHSEISDKRSAFRKHFEMRFLERIAPETWKLDYDEIDSHNNCDYYDKATSVEWYVVPERKIELSNISSVITSNIREQNKEAIFINKVGDKRSLWEVKHEVEGNMLKLNVVYDEDIKCVVTVLPSN